MKVLHVNKYLYRRGGAEAYMLDLGELQEAHGHEVRLFGMAHPENPPLPDSDLLAPFMEIGTVSGGPMERLQTAGRMIWNRRAQRGIAELVSRWRPDVVHLHNIYHQLSPSILRPLQRAGVGVVMTLHDFKLVCPSYQLLANGEICEACIPHRFQQAPLRACKDGSRAQSALLALEVSTHTALRAYGPVHRFICPSRFLLAKMQAGRVFPERLRHVPHFVHSGEEPGGNPDGPIVFAGRLSPEKGVADLIEASRLLPEPLRVVVAGDGPLRAELEDLARGAGAPVSFTGRLDRGQLFDLLRSASAFALPARWYENQPMSILEASVLGVPTVASNLGGIPELVLDGETGVLVPHGDPVALAAGLRRAVQDRAVNRRLGEAARRRAQGDEFSVRAHLAALDGLYDQARQEASGRHSTKAPA